MRWGGEGEVASGGDGGSGGDSSGSVKGDTPAASTKDRIKGQSSTRQRQGDIPRNGLRDGVLRRAGWSPRAHFLLIIFNSCLYVYLFICVFIYFCSFILMFIF